MRPLADPQENLRRRHALRMQESAELDALDSAQRAAARRGRPGGAILEVVLVVVIVALLAALLGFEFFGRDLG